MSTLKVLPGPGRGRPYGRQWLAGLRFLRGVAALRESPGFGDAMGFGDAVSNTFGDSGPGPSFPAPPPPPEKLAAAKLNPLGKPG